MRTVLTYGTFDLLHIGHINILERLAQLGDRLIVGVSTDEFNAEKGKQSVYSFEERSKIVGALRCVDKVIPEQTWDQKIHDINHFNVNVFGMGNDWCGKFDELNKLCEVVYLERTDSISTTQLKRSFSKIDAQAIQQIKDGLDGVLSIVKAIE